MKILLAILSIVFPAVAFAMRPPTIEVGAENARGLIAGSHVKMFFSLPCASQDNTGRKVQPNGIVKYSSNKRANGSNQTLEKTECGARTRFSENVLVYGVAKSEGNHVDQLTVILCLKAPLAVKMQQLNNMGAHFEFESISAVGDNSSKQPSLWSDCVNAMQQP